MVWADIGDKVKSHKLKLKNLYLLTYNIDKEKNIILSKYSEYYHRYFYHYYVKYNLESNLHFIAVEINEAVVLLIVGICNLYYHLHSTVPIFVSITF